MNWRTRSKASQAADSPELGEQEEAADDREGEFEDYDDSNPLSKRVCQQELTIAISGLDKALSISQQTIKKAWRNLIWTYCRYPGSFNFPKWAMENLSEHTINTCLEAEFSAETLLRVWVTERPQKQKRILARFLDLHQAQTLALWFGAEANRTPAGRPTIVQLCQALETSKVDSDEFQDVTYVHIIEELARQCDIDMTQPTHRLRVVFARRYPRQRDPSSMPTKLTWGHMKGAIPVPATQNAESDDDAAGSSILATGRNNGHAPQDNHSSDFVQQDEDSPERGRSIRGHSAYRFTPSLLGRPSEEASNGGQVIPLQSVAGPATPTPNFTGRQSFPDPATPDYDMPHSESGRPGSASHITSPPRKRQRVYSAEPTDIQTRFSAARSLWEYVQTQELEAFTQQDDTVNCGVYALAMACFLSCGYGIPPLIHSRLWRPLVLALAAKSALRSGLPGWLISAQRYRQESEASASSPPGPDLEQGTWHLVRVRREVQVAIRDFQSAVAEYQRRKAYIDHMNNVLLPCLQHLTKIISAAIPTIATGLSALERDHERWDKAWNMVKDSETNKDEAAWVARVLRKLFSQKQHQNRRLAIAQSASEALMALDILSLQDELATAAGRYGAYITEAQVGLRKARGYLTVV